MVSVVNKLKYLGSILDKNGWIKAEINHRENFKDK